MLNAIPADQKVFRGPSPTTMDQFLAAHGRARQERIILENYEDTNYLLRSQELLWRECRRQVMQDSAATTEKQVQFADECQARADSLSVQADLAMEAWTKGFVEAEVFRKSTNVFTICEQRIESLHAADPGEFDLGREYVIEHKMQFSLAMIRQCANKYPQDPNLHWLVGFLTAGPAELRDPALALQITRQAVELRPEDELANQSLGWALFRNGEFEECIKVLAADGSSLRNKTTPEVSVVVAMALCELGRREEAATWLLPEYDVRLQRYVETKKESRKKGISTYPSEQMLQQLDQEAKAMLGANPTELAKVYYQQDRPDDAVFLEERGYWYQKLN